MKKIWSLILFMFLCLAPLFLACSSSDSPSPSSPANSNAKNKIMPLGASRVDGDRPAYESYRYELWKRLTDGGYDFDFVGTRMDGSSYPAHNGQTFDVDHEGRGGITSGGILSEINSWLNELGSSPDIVLFSSPGGNDGIDVYEQTKLNINAIIDALQANNPNVTIFLELPAPPLVSEQTSEFLSYYNQALADLPVLAAAQTTATSRVIPIDMKTGFIDAYLADDVHYNEAGAMFIANKYYEELVKVLQ